MELLRQNAIATINGTEVKGIIFKAIPDANSKKGYSKEQTDWFYANGYKYAGWNTFFFPGDKTQLPEAMLEKFKSVKGTAKITAYEKKAKKPADKKTADKKSAAKKPAAKKSAESATKKPATKSILDGFTEEELAVLIKLAKKLA